jgi:uncharacterized integral membrane protein (TIGR00698 family)
MRDAHVPRPGALLVPVFDSAAPILDKSRLSASRPLLAGVALSGTLAIIATVLGGNEWCRTHGLSALTLAIVLGMLVGNATPNQVATSCDAGINFSKQTLLRLGVILYGLRLTVQDIERIGLAGLIIDTLVLTSTFALALLVGIRWMGLDRKTAMLVGAGSSICGAAAVIATEPVVKARPEQVTIAVATVVTFGTLAIFLYPLLLQLSPHLPWIPGREAFGIYVGSTVHEVAQVVAAARSAGPDATGAAVITKMVRVLMLAPVLLLLSAWLARDAGRHDHSESDMTGGATKVAVPWFALGFGAVTLFNSLHWLPARLVEGAVDVDTFLLTMAMAALGMSTQLGAIRKAGAKPLMLALILFCWLVAGGALINRWVVQLLA